MWISIIKITVKSIVKSNFRQEVPILNIVTYIQVEEKLKIDI